MLSTIAEIITDSFIKRGRISPDEKSVYQYGFEITISNLVSIITIVFASIVLGEKMYALTFIGFFMLLRLFCGGYHAKTYLNCFFITLFIFLSTIGLYRAAYIISPQGFALLFVVVGYILVFIFAPVIDPNNPLPVKRIRRNKLISRFISSIQVILILGFIVSSNVAMALMAASSLFMASLLIIIGMFTQRKLNK